MLGIIIALVLLASPAAARDFGQWENQSPQVRTWFQKLMQPDVPTMSCCGEADAYWADSFEVDEDRYVAIITDERPDGPLGRPHRELGEKIVVPNHKIKWDDGNPTGHGIIFIGTGGQVFCYVPQGGVGAGQRSRVKFQIHCPGRRTTRCHADQPHLGALSAPAPHIRAIAVRRTASSENRLLRPSSLALEPGPVERQ